MEPTIQTVPVSQKRRAFIIGGASILLIAALVYGFFNWKSHPYRGLETERDVEMTEDIRATFLQRIRVTQAAIEIQKKEQGKADLNLYTTLGWDAYAVGDLVLAREVYEEFLQLNPLHVASWNSYGNVLLDMGDKEVALDAYNQAVTLQPSEEFYRDYLELYRELYPEDKETVRTRLEEAVQNIGQTPWLMAELAAWYLNAGDCTAAFSHYDVAKTLIPDNEGLDDLIAEARATCTAR